MCSGQRPARLRCSNKGLRCLWDKWDGLYNTFDFKRKLQESVSQLGGQEALIEVLRSGTDHMSTLLLAKLRLGVATDELVRWIKLDSSHENGDGYLDV